MARDLIVVIPGIGGSVLRRGASVLWDTSWKGFAKAIFTAGLPYEQLALNADGGDGGVEATALVRGLHIIPGLWSYGSYRPLTKRLEDHFGPASIVEFPYDWRRSSAVTGHELHRTLAAKIEGYPSDIQIVLVAHSMGGLVARRFLATSPLAERCRLLITVGTPYRGAAKALGAVVNGVGIPGPAGTALTGFIRTLPSVYELLPTYDCLVEPDGGRRGLACEPGLLPDPGMLEQATQFHADTNAAFGGDDSGGVDTVAIVGQRQRTAVLAELPRMGSIRLIDDDTWIESDSQNGHFVRGAGDGTVPRGASQPPEWGGRVSGAHPFDGRHSNLPQLKQVWHAIYGAITGHWFANLGIEESEGFGIGLPDTVVEGAEVTSEAMHSTEDALALNLQVTDLDGGNVGGSKRLKNLGGGRYSAVVHDLPPGLYEVSVSGNVGGGRRRVSDVITVYPADV